MITFMNVKAAVRKRLVSFKKSRQAILRSDFVNDRNKTMILTTINLIEEAIKELDKRNRTIKRLRKRNA